MSETVGDAVLKREIMEKAIEATILKLRETERPKVEIPAPLKWAGGIIAALFTAGTATLVFWLVSSVSEMQVTLARMDERMASGTTVQSSEIDALKNRVGMLEAYHRGGGR